MPTRTKSINEEVGFLLRIIGVQGDVIRSKLRRERVLKLKVQPSLGRAFTADEQGRMLEAARTSTLAARRAINRQITGESRQPGERQGGSPAIYPALVIALNTGMRDAEIRKLTWGQIDFEKRMLTVGRAKSRAGEGRTIPLNETVLEALRDHSAWFAGRFESIRQAWYVSPAAAVPRLIQRNRLLRSRRHGARYASWQMWRAVGTITGIR